MAGRLSLDTGYYLLVMNYNYFGMTTDAWNRKHPSSSETSTQVADRQPLCFITVDKPAEHPLNPDCYCMRFRAATSHSRDLIAPRYLHRDKQSLTEDPNEACEVPWSWKYNREHWRPIASKGIDLMADLARQSGITQLQKWLE